MISKLTYSSAAPISTWFPSVVDQQHPRQSQSASRIDLKQIFKFLYIKVLLSSVAVDRLDSIVVIDAKQKSGSHPSVAAYGCERHI